MFRFLLAFFAFIALWVCLRDGFSTGALILAAQVWFGMALVLVLVDRMVLRGRLWRGYRSSARVRADRRRERRRG